MAKDIVITLKLEKGGLIKGLGEAKNAFDAVWGAAKKVGQVIDENLSRTHQYTQLLRANTLSINEAKKATAGYLTNMDLLTAANMASGFQLGLTSKEFAIVAKNAVTLGKAMGIDAQEGMTKFIKGLAMGRKALIDDLGVTVDVASANKRYAKQLGRTTGQLTDAQRKQAFMNAALEDMKKKAKAARLEATTAADKYIILKNATTDTKDEIVKMVGESRTLAKILGTLTEIVKNLPGFFDSLGTSVRESTDEMEILIKRWMSLAKLAAGGAGPVSSILDVFGQTFGKSLTRRNMEGRSHRIRKRRLEELQRVIKETAKQAQALAGSLGGDDKPPGTKRREVEQLPTMEGSQAFIDAMKKAKEMEQAVKMQAKLRELQAEALKEQERAQAGRAPGRGVLARTLGAIEEFDAYHARITELTAAYRQFGAAALEGADANTKLAVQMNANAQVTKEVKTEMWDMATGALASFTAGIWAAADAAIQGGESFGMAMAKMLKTTLLSIAQEAQVQVLVHLARAAALWWTGGGWAAELAAAGAWQVAAAAAGGAGLAVSSGIKSAGGYDRERQRNARTGAEPVFGQRARQAQQNLFIEVYLTNNPDDPGAALLQTAHIQKTLAQPSAA